MKKCLLGYILDKELIEKIKEKVKNDMPFSWECPFYNKLDQSAYETRDVCDYECPYDK